jgi:hypothetical protein
MTQNADAREALLEVVRQLLKYWHKGDMPDLGLLTKLRLYKTLVVQSDQVSPEPSAIVRQLLEQSVTFLGTRNKSAAELLQQRYFEGTSAKKMALRLHVAESHYYHVQNDALSQLADIILEQEQEVRLQYQVAVKVRLETPPDQSLFGVSQERKQLYTVIEQAEQPWLIAIDGIGGIGKTALANALAHELVETDRFYDIAWVSARQQEFLPSLGLQPATNTSHPALDVDTLADTLLTQLDGGLPPSASPQEKMLVLTGLLRRFPYLVIIDNLETVVDYQALLPTLRKLANPSKFLLTSRHSLHTYSDVFCVSLKELSRAHVFAFLRHEAEVRGLPALANALPAQLESIYQVVGGNPLALKLVIGQICVLPLPLVLENLKQARGKKTDELYTYIYWQAWQTMDALSRQLLLVMPLAQDGTLAQLIALSELEADGVNQALEQLMALSLVEVRGDLQQHRYRIHRLTETFLLNEVVKWQLSP